MWGMYNCISFVANMESDSIFWLRESSQPCIIYSHVTIQISYERNYSQSILDEKLGLWAIWELKLRMHDFALSLIRPLNQFIRVELILHFE